MPTPRHNTPQAARYSRNNSKYQSRHQAFTLEPDDAAVGKVTLIIAAICIVVLVALGSHAARNIVGEGSGLSFSSLLESAQAVPHSEPQSQWRQGEVPLLYQTDKAWADEPYGNATIGDSGCGPISLLMTYVALTGDTSLGPKEMAKFAEDKGFVYDKATKWSLMEAGAQLLGLTSEEMPADINQVTAALSSGKYVVAIMGPGDFTQSGHFVVLHKPDGAGNIFVADSNSPENSSHPWELQKVLSQAKRLWVLSV